MGKGLRAWLGLLGVFAASFSVADTYTYTMSERGLTHILGTLSAVDVQGGVFGTQIVPLRVDGLVRESIYFRYSIECTQTHYMLNDVLTPLGTPRGVWSGAGPTEDIVTKWVDNLAAQTTDKNKYGQFQVRITQEESPNGSTGWALTAETSFIWVWSPWMARADQSNLEGGGATAEDINNQNVNQVGFWEGLISDLFIPSDGSVDNLSDALDQWAVWGPFGIYNIINDKVGGQAGSASRIDQTEAYVITFPILGSALSIDLNPYVDFINFGRAITAGGMWFAIVFVLYRKIYAKA